MTDLARAVRLARALFGALLVSVPRRMLAPFGRPASTVVVLTRVLGVRHLLQAAVGLPRRVSGRPAVAAFVDAAHVGSMLIVAAASPRHRRVCLANAATAAALAVASAVAADQRGSR